MRSIFFILALLSIIIISGCTPNNQSITEKNDTRTCITEPGKAIYQENEKCCGELIPISGSELPDGRCWCTGKDNNCAGAPTCAPCGNEICESEYREDRCSCPQDCK